MSTFKQCCGIREEKIGAHDLRLLESLGEKRDRLCVDLASKISAHYLSPDRMADILERLGRRSAAIALRNRMPDSMQKRSGELGEIIATEYVDAETDYYVPIRRLRWKDDREMPMRGDDIIAINLSGRKSIEFLKGEVKSTRSLSKKTVAEARDALAKDLGRPSPHALSFLADRLNEIGERDLANEIEQAQLKDGISLDQVAHLLFTFSQNDPRDVLQEDLSGCDGDIRQHGVGLTVSRHQEFIDTAYEMAGHGSDS